MPLPDIFSAVASFISICIHRSRLTQKAGSDLYRGKRKLNLIAGRGLPRYRAQLYRKKDSYPQHCLFAWFPVTASPIDSLRLLMCNKLS